MTDETVDTGLAGLTAAVTIPDEPEPVSADTHIPVVSAPAYTKAPLPDGWNLNKVADLVREIAQNMYDLPTILANHGLTEPQYRTIEENEFFQSALKQFTLDWNSASNTQKRLALEAAIAIEHHMPAVTARLGKPMEPLGEIVALLKVLAEIAGTIGAKAASQPNAPTEKFKIIINLGADTFQRDASVAIREQSQGEGDHRAIQSLLEVAGAPSPVQADTKGS